MANGRDHYIRLVVFAVEGCPQPLVELFLKMAKADVRPSVSYSSIDTYLKYHQPTIQTMLKRKFIHASQLHLILPGPTDPPVDINKWDISLVTTMLHNLFTLSFQEQKYIGDIRTVRNELLHKAGTAELEERDFTTKWNTLETAVTGLAQCVSTDFCNEMTSYIMVLKTKPLPPPGPVLDILKQWYIADKELKNVYVELQIDTKLAMATSKNAKNILNDVVVRSEKPSGAPLKKIKIVDPVLENMKGQFKLTMQRYQNEEYEPPNEMEDVKLKFRHNHRVVINGKGSLEAALTVISDEGIRHDRCVQLTEPDEARHICCDDVELVLCINPFGNNRYDENQSTAMTKQFDRMLEHTNLDGIDGRIYVIIVSETEPFLEYCRLKDHDLLDKVVTLNKPTTDSEPIHVSDCVKNTISQPEPILQNMIGQSELYFEQFRGLHVDENLFTRTKTLFKKHKAITITGHTHVRKEILAVKLMTEHRPDKCLVLTNPDDWKYVKLGDVSVLLISNFTGKCECDLILYTKWLSIFDMIHAAVKRGKLNLILTSHNTNLEKCKEQSGTHDLLEQGVELADEDILKANIKRENNATKACTSSHDNNAVIDAPHSLLKKYCLKYVGQYTPQLDDDGDVGEIRSIQTVSDGTFLMIVDKITKVYLYHIDSSYNYFNRLKIGGHGVDSDVVSMNKREAAVRTNRSSKIHIIALGDNMRVTRAIDIDSSIMRSMMAYMDGDFFIPICPDNNIEVYSVTGTKVRTIEYDKECGQDDTSELMEIESVVDIAVSEDRIVLSAQDNKYKTYIICLKMNGERIWLLNISKTYSIQMSIYLDNKCNVYYTCNANDSEIHRVSACSQFDVVLLKFPVDGIGGLCIDVKRQVLYTMNIQGNTLYVYKLC